MYLQQFFSFCEKFLACTGQNPAVNPRRSRKIGGRDGFFADKSGVAKFEYAVFVSLNGLVCLCHFKPLFGKGYVFFFAFNADIMTAELGGGYRSGTGAEERVKNDIAFVAGGQNQLGYQLFRLLGGMGRVFGHRPEWDGNVRPQIGRRSQPVFSPFNFFVFLPVFGNAVAVFVRGENRALQLNGIQIESVFGRFGEKPDVFNTVFPVIA